MPSPKEFEQKMEELKQSHEAAKLAAEKKVEEGERQRELHEGRRKEKEEQLGKEFENTFKPVLELTNRDYLDGKGEISVLRPFWGKTSEEKTSESDLSDLYMMGLKWAEEKCGTMSVNLEWDIKRKGLRLSGKRLAISKELNEDIIYFGIGDDSRAEKFDAQDKKLEDKLFTAILNAIREDKCEWGEVQDNLLGSYGP